MRRLDFVIVIPQSAEMTIGFTGLEPRSSDILQGHIASLDVVPRARAIRWFCPKLS